MSSRSRVEAFLGLDISAFQSGLDKANGLLARFKAAAKIGGATGAIGGFLGAGAIIAGFRSVLNNAQEARDAAKALGREIDSSTAAAARLADQWDSIKGAIGSAATGVIGFAAKLGEKAGSNINDNMDRAREFFGGQSAAESRRIRAIDVEAEANAERLGSPEAKAAAKARGDAKRESAKKAADEAKKKRDTELATANKAASEEFEEQYFKQLSLEMQLYTLQKKRGDFRMIEQDMLSTETQRAVARAGRYKVEGQIREKTLEIEKKVADEQTTQAEQQARINEIAAKAYDVYQKALSRDSAAGAGLAGAKRDALGFTVGDAVSGARGNVAAQEAARGIARDEATAKSLSDSGRSVTLFDAATQRNQTVGAQFFQERALAARGKLDGLTSAERSPFADAEAELKAAAADLKGAADALKNATIELEVEGD
jgi:hypothetical protein